MDSEEIPLPAKKVTRDPSQTQATTSSKPNLATSALPEVGGGQSTVLVTEKDALRQPEPPQAPKSGENEAKDTLSSGGGSLKQERSKGAIGRQLSAKEIRNQQPLPPVPQDAEKSVRAQDSVSNPAVVVDAPTAISQKKDQNSTAAAQSSQQDTEATDQAMAEAPSAPSEEESKSLPNDRNESRTNTSTTGLPPPPPIPGVSTTGASPGPTTAEPIEEKQQWLLPPIEPRFHGKKCLVLDLDETLVHSSFKVTLPIYSKALPANYSRRYYIRQISLFRSRSRVSIIMST